MNQEGKIRAKKMVLEGRLELPWVAPLAPQASASAISPPEHNLVYVPLIYTLFAECQAVFRKKTEKSSSKRRKKSKIELEKRKNRGKVKNDPKHSRKPNK